MNYREAFERILEPYLFDPWDDITRNNIESTFRGVCPGPYKIKWNKDLDKNYMPQFELVFEDSKEATAWYLRWA